MLTLSSLSSNNPRFSILNSQVCLPSPDWSVPSSWWASHKSSADCR